MRNLDESGRSLMSRRELLKSVSAAAVVSTAGLASGQPPVTSPARTSELWGCHEVTLQGSTIGNPFQNVQLSAVFKHEHASIEVAGFYDGNGKYKVRFMPSMVGTWTYVTTSNVQELSGRKGTFECTQAKEDNHGPVVVRDRFHFGYEDGMPYTEIGTTCYAWAFQTEELQRQTIRTLAGAPFNKLRMCLFPKWYQHNHREPPMYPFPRNGETNDYSTFITPYFQHLDALIVELRDMGIQADLILFHPYDKWGYQSMPAEVDDRYLRYVIARYAAYRNVWWSLANEYDFMKAKSAQDWERFARIVTDEDPYGHMRSIHYGYAVPDYSRRWCTHAGIQSHDMEKAAEWRSEWNKPLIYDECQYEGNIGSSWGNLPGVEMTRRFWLATVGGAYCGHGETYLSAGDDLWWAHGGRLNGSSPKQIAFLRKMLEETIALGEGPIGFNPIPGARNFPGAKRANNKVIFFYFDVHQPAEQAISLPEGISYRAEYIDTLKMTRQSLPGVYKGETEVKLPGTPFGSVWFFATGS